MLTPRIKWIALIVTILWIVAAGTGLFAQSGAARVKAPDRMDPAVKSLIEARIATAREVFKSIMLRCENAPIPLPDDTPAWSRRWMEDQIRLGLDPVGKLSAIQDHLERIRRLESIKEQYAKAGQGLFEDVLKMKYYRLEAEQMLAEVRAANPGVTLPRPKAAERKPEAAPQPPPPPALPR